MINNLPLSRITFRNTYIVLLAVSFASIIMIMVADNIVGSVIFVCCIIGVLSFWFPWIILVAFTISTIIIPTEALPYLSGSSVKYGFGNTRIHPGELIIFIGAVCHILSGRDIILTIIKENKYIRWVVILSSIFLLSIFFQTFLQRGAKGIPQCLENYLIPFMFFLFLLKIERKDFFSILKYYIAILVIIALYGIVEFIIKKNLIYDSAYAYSSMWYEQWWIGGYRISTTIGHPLKNATFFLFAFVMSNIYSKKKLYVYMLQLLFFIAIMCTGSRIGLILAIFTIIFSQVEIKFRSLNVFRYFKQYLFIILAIGISITLLTKTPIGTLVLSRFETAHDSSLVRLTSINNAWEILCRHSIFGKGMGLSYDESAQIFGRLAGFENPWIMLIVDVGFITTLLYLCIFLKIIMFYTKSKGSVDREIIFLSFFLMLIMVSSYNSFGSRNTINFLIWFNIALIFKYVSLYIYNQRNFNEQGI